MLIYQGFFKQAKTPSVIIFNKVSNNISMLGKPVISAFVALAFKMNRGMRVNKHKMIALRDGF